MSNANTCGFTGICLSALDLAASKLVAFREKDRAFVRALLSERLVKETALLKVLDELPVEVGRREALKQWVTDTVG